MRIAGFFAYRVPFLSMATLTAWADGMQAPAASPGDLEAALAHDHAVLRDRLLQVARRPEVTGALSVASPDLVDALEKRDCDAGVLAALVRYVTRMASRPTPFGLFAACGVGDIAQRTSIAVPHPATWRRHTRLDGDYLDRVVQARGAELRPRLRFRPNDSVYFGAGQCRYVQVRFEKRERTHHLAQAEDTPVLRRALDLARDGALPHDLAAALTGPDLGEGVAIRFVDDLIGAQLLVPELALTLTGPRPLEALLTDLSAAGDRQAVATLSKVDDELSAIDQLGPGAPPERHAAVGAMLDGLPAPAVSTSLLQVDTTVPACGAVLAQSVVDEVVRGVDLLRRIAPRSQPTDLDRFRDAFVERYEQREVPLLEALDHDLGVGYGGAGSLPAPLLKGVPRPRRERDAPAGPREERLLEMLHRTWDSRGHELVLTQDDIAALERREPATLPDAFAALVSLARTSGGQRVVLWSAGGAGGAGLLGRFCHADPDLAARVREHVQAEEALDPDAAYAEIVHLPEGRISNILVRPVLRGWELEWLGRSGAPADRRLPVSDLMVSVRDGRLVLRSRRLGRRIVPRLASAHNADRRSPAVYRFLAAMQTEGTVGGVAWSWEPFDRAAFTPRVRWGSLVLALARWTVKGPELRSLDRAGPADRWHAVQAWRDRLRLPRWICLVDADNKLVVDLDNVLSIETLVRAVRQREEARLEELYPAPDELVAEGPDGPRTLELVIPIVRKPEAGARPYPSVSSSARRWPADADVWRVFPPGSDWTYLKLYTGRTTADAIIRDHVAPAVRELAASGAADRWFFIRYEDPGFHLRVRVHGRPEILMASLQEIANQALESGLAHDVQLATYQREVERYGGPSAIEIVEQIFHADSDTVTELLEMFAPGASGQAERWQIGVLGADALMRDLGLNDKARSALYLRVRAAFERESGGDTRLRRAVADRVRDEETSVARLLELRDDDDHPLAPGLRVLSGRSRRVEPLTAELVNLRSTGRLDQGLDDLAVSLVHMWLNRLCLSENRLHEHVTYALLARVLQARLARAHNRLAAHAADDQLAGAGSRP